jgi:hypothetical protein
MLSALGMDKAVMVDYHDASRGIRDPKKNRPELKDGKPEPVNVLERILE